MVFLENRVAELEARLATYSPDNVDVADHLRQNPFTPASPSSGTVSNQNNPHNNYAAGVALLSLNSANEPHYLGLSSGFSWARTILGIFKPPSTSLFTPDDSRNRPSHPSVTERRRPSFQVRRHRMLVSKHFTCTFRQGIHSWTGGSSNLGSTSENCLWG
jgi:hypothetical protein